MRSTTITFAMAVTISLAFSGCRSHESRVAELQRHYDELGDQFQKDCSAEMLNLPQKLSPKCADEKQKLGDAFNQLQAERAKK
jgi:hypothetical protein